jgi:hypothetical protein
MTSQSFLLARLSMWWCILWVRKNLKNRLNQENQKKNNLKNQIVKKTRLIRLKFWKNRPVRFGFISLKPNRTEKTKKNRAKSVWTGFFFQKTEPKPVGLNRFRFFFLNSVWLLFFYKNRTKPKMIIPLVFYKYM